MLRSLNQLTGYTVCASDGLIGHVSEFYFDDAKWVVRYLVADIGKWLRGRRVLISPAAFQRPVWEEQTFPLAVSRAQVQSSPDIDTDQPIVRQQEARLHQHYGWELYFGAESLIGQPGLVSAPEEPAANKDGKPFDPHLRTTRVVTGHHIHALDGAIGHVADFIADDENWTIRYLVVDTRDLLPGKKVLLAPEWTKQISWEKRVLYVDLTREQVRASPPFDPSALVNRQYEERVYDYYGRPGYWRVNP